MLYTGLFLSLISYVSFCEFSVAANRQLAHVKHYDVVRLQNLKGRMERSVTSQQKYPDRTEFALVVDGKNITIYLEKNRELLGKNYTLTHYTKNGMKVTTLPSKLDHCYYQGHIQNVKDSSVSVGLCSGIRGFLRAENQVYLIEPLEESVKGDHALYKQEHLQTKRAAAGYINDTVNYLGPRFAGLYKSGNMKNKGIGGQRFVELVLVADHKLFKKIGNLVRIEKRMMEIANHVDKLYRPLNIRIMLVGLEVWTNGDQIEVSSQPSTTLDRFLKWRNDDLLKRKKHDNAQFVTAVDFEGSTVGLAPVSVMCSHNSGAVNEDHSDNSIGVASTIAHEMGHNLGMSHDMTKCVCPTTSQDQGCVMEDSIGIVYPKAFSSCSKVALETFLQNYDVSCLLDLPNDDALYGGPVCGNAFVEKGEECDCGTVEECKNPCCNATTCRLTEGSQCAHGECCHNCQLKKAGSLCRRSAHDCDLDDFCTGESAYCPKDEYKMNGLPCNSNQGYCYNGQCPTHTEHCQKLWGPDADVDSNACFELNAFDQSCSRPKYGKCAEQHIKCGKIYCSGGNEFPITQTKYMQSMGMRECYLAVKPSSTEEIGMVPTGTKCGTNKVCYNSFCQDIGIYGTKNCSAKCNNHGVCNHERQCHCDPGWAPPYCDVKLSELNKKDAVVIGVTTSIAILLLIIIVIAALACCRTRSTFPKKRSFKEKDINSGQSNPVFQTGSANNSPRSGPPRVSHPTFLESTTTQACKPLFRPTAPNRPAPEPPTVAAQCRMEQIVRPCMVRPNVPSISLIQAKPLLPPSKPLPPSRPLPPLMSKSVNNPKSPPVPPAKPSGKQPAWKPSQAMAVPKVPLKPPYI
ncbi:disintegrin and metalloproteinase domain-containing protein 8a [Electrophorus electricus]|uniref:disintegrin and metalloproteinase domain-containing protein 8a n=1 Tax=Electrophorus electricus TaxID=8005 RepID=UPI0015CF8E14|nr:disintegrin and metalloproteinase domain-containing protein 8a [Electrophorus electricus]